MSSTMGPKKSQSRFAATMNKVLHDAREKSNKRLALTKSSAATTTEQLPENVQQRYPDSVQQTSQPDVLDVWGVAEKFVECRAAHEIVCDRLKDTLTNKGIALLLCDVAEAFRAKYSKKSIAIFNKVIQDHGAAFSGFTPKDSAIRKLAAYEVYKSRLIRTPPESPNASEDNDVGEEQDDNMYNMFEDDSIDLKAFGNHNQEFVTHAPFTVNQQKINYPQAPLINHVPSSSYKGEPVSWQPQEHLKVSDTRFIQRRSHTPDPRSNYSQHPHILMREQRNAESEDDEIIFSKSDYAKYEEKPSVKFAPELNAEVLNKPATMMTQAEAEAHQALSQYDPGPTKTITEYQLKKHSNFDMQSGGLQSLVDELAKVKTMIAESREHTKKLELHAEVLQDIISKR